LSTKDSNSKRKHNYYAQKNMGGMGRNSYSRYDKGLDKP